MMERFFYYELRMADPATFFQVDFAAACSLSGTEGGFVFGWFMVVLATVIVIASFYLLITRMLWPGEEDQNHIKRRILIDDESSHAN